MSDSEDTYDDVLDTEDVQECINHENKNIEFVEEISQTDTWSIDEKLYKEMCDWESWQLFLNEVLGQIHSYIDYQYLPIGSRLNKAHLELFFNNIR